MDFLRSDSFSQREHDTHTLSVEQDLETPEQLSSQELSDTLATRAHAHTHTYDTDLHSFPADFLLFEPLLD